MALAQRERDTANVIKRIFVGRSMASGRMEHTLLPKVLALPIFASDALSSVAYCVEASLLVLLSASANYRQYLIPINVAVAAVMAIVITSYKQVVRAYPTSAGSYVVSKDNLATIFGLVAAAALLVDYVLTVAVSVSSGVLALVSAAPRLHPYLVEMCVGCVILLLAVNLRGVRESGALFAVPTYGFVVAMLALILVGFAKCLGSCPQVDVASLPDPYATGAAASVGVFVILHSFASGSSALTGTEAISNGVSAFRRPQWRNASQTLTMLGILAVVMISGTAYLAYRTNPRPDHQVSVVSEMAKVVFPGSRPGSGGFMFYVVQFFTLLILVLAANTSFQGFPRLAALLARDRWIPRQFENLGDRLVYSNGMVLLSGLAIVLILLYHANVDALIQLYVVGVFTAFTLSQAGMVRHWRKAAREGGERAQGWHWRLAINAVGAVATGLVLVVVVFTKFLEGAWIVITAIPVLILLFHAIHRHYEGVRVQLRRELRAPGEPPANQVVVVVEGIDAALAEAVGYVRSFAGDDFRAVHLHTPADPPDLAARWRAFCRVDAIPLEMLDPGDRDPVRTLIDFVRAIPREQQDFVTVVVPELLPRRSLLTALRRRTSIGLKLRLLREPQIVITDVPVLAPRAGGRRAGRPWIPRRVEAMVFVASVNDASLRAIDYARSLRATRTRAVFFAYGAEDAMRIQEDWERYRVPVELDIVEAPFRELDAPILREVRSVTGQEDSVALVIVPEFRVRRWRHQLLHNQRALFIKRLLLFEDRVVLSSVPYQLA